MHVTVTNRADENVGFQVFTKPNGSETLFDLGNYSMSVIIDEDMGSAEIVIDKKESTPEGVDRED